MKHNLTSRRWKWRGRPVTVCIAAICGAANDPTIIGVSDRLVTMGDIESEIHVVKFSPCPPGLHPKLYVMLAGLPAHIHPIMQVALEQALAMGGMTVQKFSELVALSFREYKKRHDEATILSPHFLTMRTFLKKQKLLKDETVRMITQRLDASVIDVQFIIAGIDDGNTPHIYQVVNPGFAYPCDDPGYAAIGIGDWRAASQFHLNGYNRFLEPAKALAVALSAKKRAEDVRSVGNENTDCFIISSGNIPNLQVPYDVMQDIMGICDDLIADEKSAMTRAQERMVEYVEKTRKENQQRAGQEASNSAGVQDGSGESQPKA